MNNIKVKKLHPNAMLPVYSSEGAACFDLFTTGEQEKHPTDIDALIFGTGLSFEIPPGYAMLVYSRSGHGFKHGIRLSNSVGVIDSDYRGEVKVSLRADAPVEDESIVAPGARIAQAMIVPVQKVFLNWSEELTETDRGEGGFGSTGA